MVITASGMFILSTCHVIIGLVRAIHAFTETEHAVLYYEEIWNGLSILKQALYATENIIADGLVVYRCYAIWGKSWKIVVIPVIMLISTTVCAYLAVYNFSQVHPGDNVFASNIAEWGTALFSLSLATNIIVTSLIAGRIWWLSRNIRTYLGQRHQAKYYKAIGIIIESGAIYAISLLILLVLYTSKTNAQYIVYDALSQIMGIVPTLIIVRIGLGIHVQDNSTTFATTVRGDDSGSVPASSDRTGRQGKPQHAVNIVIHKNIESTTLDNETNSYERNSYSMNELGKNDVNMLENGDHHKYPDV
jgi:hypothetical protein